MCAFARRSLDLSAAVPPLGLLALLLLRR